MKQTMPDKSVSNLLIMFFALKHANNHVEDNEYYNCNTTSVKCAKTYEFGMPNRTQQKLKLELL